MLVKSGTYLVVNKYEYKKRRVYYVRKFKRDHEKDQKQRRFDRCRIHNG